MTTPHSGPIESAVAALLAFTRHASGGPVRVGTPADGAAPGLWLWPYELRPQRLTTGSGQRHPYRFALRCLVGGDAADSLGQLDKVLAEAVRAGEPELSLEAPDPQLWRALGLPPRPVLTFDMPASVAHPTPHVTPVRGPLVLRHIDLRPLIGTVLGPGDQPVAGARVEVAGTQLAAYTDRHGTFTFPAVPAGSTVGLRVIGRGETFTATIALTDDQPVTVHCGFGGAAGTPSGPDTGN